MTTIYAVVSPESKIHIKTEVFSPSSTIHTPTVQVRPLRPINKEGEPGKARRQLAMNANKGNPVINNRRNARERNRVKQVNEGFAFLRSHLPFTTNNKKTSKVDTLRTAIDYIQGLTDLLMSADSCDSGSEDFKTTPVSNLHLAQEDIQSTPRCVSPPPTYQHHHLLQQQQRQYDGHSFQLQGSYQNQPSLNHSSVSDLNQQRIVANTPEDISFEATPSPSSGFCIGSPFSSSQIDVSLDQCTSSPIVKGNCSPLTITPNNLRSARLEPPPSYSETLLQRKREVDTIMDVSVTGCCRGSTDPVVADTLGGHSSKSQYIPEQAITSEIDPTITPADDPTNFPYQDLLSTLRW